MESDPQLDGLSLVLGGSGFLGAHLIAALVAQARSLATMAEVHGPPVVGVSREPELAPRFAQPRDAARWEALDLLDPAATEALMQRLQPRRIFLCAALARVLDCERDPGRADALNAELPRRIAAWCAERKVRLVHISTDLVFGGEAPPPGGFSESNPTAPLSYYGASKARGEESVLKTYPEALVVRLPLLYGDSAGRGLGASDALLAAVDADQQPELFVDEFRTPLEVKNAARALVELSLGGTRGLLHVAGPERVSRYEIGVALLEGMGLLPNQVQSLLRQASASDHPELGPRPRDVALNAARARKLLRTQLMGLREGIRQALS